MRTWERNPQYYGDLLSTSLAGQVLFDYAPLPERARRVLSKLHQVPRLMQAARDNIKDPPGIFIKVGLESLRGTLRFIEDGSAARLRRPPRHARARGPRRRVDGGGARRSGPASPTSRTTSRRALAAPFRLGRDVFEQKLPPRRRDHARRRPAAGHRPSRAARRRRKSSGASRHASIRSRRIRSPPGPA